MILNKKHASYFCKTKVTCKRLRRCDDTFKSRVNLKYFELEDVHLLLYRVLNNLWATVCRDVELVIRRFAWYLWNVIKFDVEYNDFYFINFLTFANLLWELIQINYLKYRLLTTVLLLSSQSIMQLFVGFYWIIEH